MNRNEEYTNLINELEANIPSLESSVVKAKNRRMRKQVIWRSVSTMAAVFALFVLLVNVSAPIAQAVSKVPFIGELAEAVKFSKSLSKAVEKEYVQPVELVETKDGITAEIEYLIADEMQVNVFYRVTSEDYTDLRVYPSAIVEGSYGASGRGGKSDGELLCYMIDFSKETPDSFTLKLNVFESGSESLLKENSLVTFDFDLEINKELMGEAKIYNIDQIVDIGGLTVNIKAIEVYPTHTRVRIDSESGDGIELSKLDFYINTDKGMKFESISLGMVTTKSSKYGTSCYGDSLYFYDAEPTELVITGAVLEGEIDYTRPIVDLTTGECVYLHDWIELVSVERKDNACTISFKVKAAEDCSNYQIFSDSVIYKGYSDSFDERLATDCGDGYFIETLTIYDWPHDKLTLTPFYKYTWTPREEITISLQ
ncbi:MAG: DUF4179 domain-containing protein [Lachnospiraceae bacterium]|nr:DUF4179 domain-containing protein [Lachnospiraceae bacterium]